MATRDELYAKFGITAEAGQLLETELSTVLMCLEGLERGWHIEPDGDAATALLQKLDGYTLGQALKRFRGTAAVGPKLSDHLVAALNACNRLNHGFYLKHGNKIQTDDGRDAMIADLEEIHTCLFAAWQIAGTISDHLMGLVTGAKETPPSGT